MGERNDSLGKFFTTTASATYKKSDLIGSAATLLHC